MLAGSRGQGGDELKLLYVRRPEEDPLMFARGVKVGL